MKLENNLDKSPFVSNMNIHKLLQSQLTEEFFKKSIFCGDVVIVKKSNEILNIIDVVEKYFSEIFDENIVSLKSGRLKYDKEINKLFIIFQNLSLIHI